MNPLSNATPHFLMAFSGSATILLAPGRCWAADPPLLPWDCTLTAIQNFVVGPVAHAVIVISGIVALLVFALGGDSELARRFARAVVGTAVALIAVQLLNYLAP
jgi:type IV secretory pathway VirB2 component (pilin)